MEPVSIRFGERNQIDQRIWQANGWAKTSLLLKKKATH
jgi:hypothetical protein